MQVIQVEVESSEQLFNSRDPTPFPGRILNQAFLDYLEASVDKTSYKKPVRIRISIGRMKSDCTEKKISEALKEHFQLRIEEKKSQLRKQLRTSRYFLFVGLLILISCLSVANLTQESETTLISDTLRVGVTILGWVAMWRPMEAVIFDWYPYQDRIRYFRKLAGAQIEIAQARRKPTNFSDVA